jgi:hypothetical protein
MYIGGMKESFKCKEIAKKNVITSPEGTRDDDDDDDFTTYTHGKPLVPCKITKMDYSILNLMRCWFPIFQEVEVDQLVEISTLVKKALNRQS